LIELAAERGPCEPVNNEYDKESQQHDNGEKRTGDFSSEADSLPAQGRRNRQHSCFE